MFIFVSELILSRPVASRWARKSDVAVLFSFIKLYFIVIIIIVIVIIIISSSSIIITFIVIIIIYHGSIAPLYIQK